MTTTASTTEAVAPPGDRTHDVRMTADNVTNLFAPDAAVIRQHLERLFARPRLEYPSGLVEIAWSNATTGAVTNANLFAMTPSGLEDALRTALAENAKHHNVYVGVNPRKSDAPPFGRCSDVDVEVAFFHFVDGDKPEAVERLIKAMTLPYTFAVTTGRVPNPRPHVYWELDEPTRNMAAWTAQQRGLATHFAGDMVINPSRIMRLAGTVNYPSAKKIERGYRIEPVTLRTEYEDERNPVDWRVLTAAYASIGEPAPQQGFHPETGEVREAGPFKPAGLDPRALIASIKAGDSLHNNARDLIAHMVGIGYADWAIRELAELLLRPVSDGGTIGQVGKLIQSARQKFGQPDPAEQFSEPEPVAPLEPTPAWLTAAAAIPRRRWVLGRSALGGALAVLVAPPGVGKSTLTIEMAIAVASGCPITGQMVHEPGPVWIFNNEDDRDELRRRVAAVIQHFRIDPITMIGRLYVNSGEERRLLVAKRDGKGGVIVTPDVEACIAHIKKHDFKLFVVDPFVETHDGEENDNAQMNFIAGLYRTIAQRTGCAVILVHHTGKPPQAGADGFAGNLNAGRGASSIPGVARIVQTLFAMSERDAEDLGVPPEQRRLFIRLDDGKINAALVSDQAQWFRRTGVTIENGDEVGVLAPEDMKAADQKRAERDMERDAEMAKRVAHVMEHGEALSVNAIAKRLVDEGAAEGSSRTVRRMVERAIGGVDAPTRTSDERGEIKLWKIRSGAGDTAPISIRCEVIR